MTFSSPPCLSAKIITFAAQWHHNFMLLRPKWTSVSSFICTLRLGRCFRLIELKINLDSAAEDWMETFPTFRIRKTGVASLRDDCVSLVVCWRPGVRCLFVAQARLFMRQHVHLWQVRKASLFVMWLHRKQIWEDLSCRRRVWSKNKTKTARPAQVKAKCGWQRGATRTNSWPPFLFLSNGHLPGPKKIYLHQIQVQGNLRHNSSSRQILSCYFQVGMQPRGDRIKTTVLKGKGPFLSTRLEELESYPHAKSWETLIKAKAQRVGHTPLTSPNRFLSKVMSGGRTWARFTTKTISVP